MWCPRHTTDLPLMVAIKMQDIKARRGPRASSQINSGGQVSMKMSIMQSILETLSTPQRKGRKSPYSYNDGYCPTPQLVDLNFTSFEMTTNLNESPKVKNVLVIVDHFTRYTRAYVTKDQKASTAAKTLYKGFILMFGAPERILMDQGKAFTSEVVKQLCSWFGISQLTTTAYHPQSNGQVEHATRLLEG